LPEGEITCNVLKYIPKIGVESVDLGKVNYMNPEQAMNLISKEEGSSG
jgi:hypothetical protein